MDREAMRKRDPGRFKKAIEMYRNGFTLREIAEVAGIRTASAPLA